MSTPRERVWEEVETGRISEVPQFILEHVYHYGCADPFITDLVARYFVRVEEEE